jgi:hypothetical protein
MLKRIFAALALASLTACASIPPNPLSAEQRSGVFVEGVSTNWSVEDGKRDQSPDYVAGKDDMQQRLTAAVQQAFANSPSGSEAVEFVVDVKNYNRVGTAQTLLIGGANMVVADVAVRRKSDGQIIGSYAGVMGLHTPPAGPLGVAVSAVTKPDPVGIMANNFAQK